jgi:hypothetical protein
VYELPNLDQVVAWYHAAAGYPTKPTWIKAIEAGFYTTWPLLTAKAVRKHFPEATQTAKGHMRRIKSGVRSTKEQVEEPLEIQKEEAALAELRKKHRDIYVKVKDATNFQPRTQIYYGPGRNRRKLHCDGTHEISRHQRIDSNISNNDATTQECRHCTQKANLGQ